MRRRAFLGMTLAAAVSRPVAAGNDLIEVSGTITSFEGNPVANARVWAPAVDPDAPGQYVRTDADGTFAATVPNTPKIWLGFYKSDSDDFLAKQLDGVPHVYDLGPFYPSDEDMDLGIIQLPEAHKVDLRAVTGEWKGAEDARPRFVHGYFGSGYGLTTDGEGYTRLIDAGFTGFELVGESRLTMRPPENDPRFDDEVHIWEGTISSDALVEIDISRRATRANL